jgi:hypothetical protein
MRVPGHQDSDSIRPTRGAPAQPSPRRPEWKSWSLSRAVETQLTATAGVGDSAQSRAEGPQCLDVALGEGGGPDMFVETEPL